jgi:hypothetical protein
MLLNHVRLRETQDVKQKAMAARTLWDLAAISYPAKRYLPYEKKDVLWFLSFLGLANLILRASQNRISQYILKKTLAYGLHVSFASQSHLKT